MTHDPADDFAPSWSPNGKEIAFHSFRNGNRDVFVMSSDGSRVEPVVATPKQERLPSWSPDGNSLVYIAIPDSVFIVSRTNGRWGTSRFLTIGGGPLWSPDGKTIAVATQAGVDLIAPDGTGRRSFTFKGHGPLAVFGGTWSADSRLIYYCIPNPDGTNSIAVLDLSSGAQKVIYHFADPLRQLYRGVIWADSTNIFFTIGTRESDVWVMELNRK